MHNIQEAMGMLCTYIEVAMHARNHAKHRTTKKI